MPQTPSPSKPPQTAADLLEGLLRSNLLAGSLFGQVLEQSRSFLEHRADEYAAALVLKRVLTQWQATELLAGRIGLYAGTFRLFERLTTTETAVVFVAEQSGPQRLVLLEVTRVERTSASAPPGPEGPSHIVLAAAAEANSFPDTARHPHIARSLEVQHAPQLLLVAYEFMEAKPLVELLTLHPLERKHVAELVRQFSTALVVLRDEALAWIGPEAAWVDQRGELQLLAGPQSCASVSQSLPGQQWIEGLPSSGGRGSCRAADASSRVRWLAAPQELRPPSGQATTQKACLDRALGQSSTSRVALQVGAIQRFAAALGGLPEIADCRSVNEVLQRLVGIAKPWSEPYARESLRCQRVCMNRLLRRGPALRSMEAFGPELQVAFAGIGPEPGPEAVTSESPISCPALTTVIEGHSLPTTATDPAPNQPKVGSGRRALAFTALLWLMAAGIVAMPWFEQRGVRRAEATTDPVELPETQPPLTPGQSPFSMSRGL